MARMNEVLVGRFNRGMQKLFGIKGPPPVAQLATEIGVQHALFNGAENRYLEGWSRYAGNAAVSGIAAQNSAVQLKNPLGSGIIGVIEKFQFLDLTAADQPFVRYVTTNLPNYPTLVTPVRLDPRQSGTGAANNNLILSQGNNQAVTGVPLYGVQVSAAPISPFECILFEDQELPLLAGDSITVETGANVTLFVNVWWRERVLEDSEKT